MGVEASVFFEAPLFRDRRDAGRQLADLLLRDGALAGDSVVVGLARGGVAVAAPVAAALGAPLDALAVRKLGHPDQPEYALGAVTPGDGVFVRDRAGLTPERLAQAVDATRREARELDAALHAERPAVAPAGRTVVLVDDGLATDEVVALLAAARPTDY
jgi:putative phosphoribosyl transferase